jgi:mannose-6-phosphate isomerase-like protein (cupin superfamily)
MRIEKTSLDILKGWYLGPWDSALPVSVGFAHQGVDKPHLHRQMTDIYLIARGTTEIRIEQATILLQANDVIVVEPGEAHTFLSSSPDHFHFVIQTPGLQGEAAQADKVPVLHSQLGL